MALVLSYSKVHKVLESTPKKITDGINFFESLPD